MAISHVQPLLLLLAIASFFVLPVLCTIKFEYCNNNTGYEFGNITSVAVNYKGFDTTIIVSGHSKKSLKKGSVLFIHDDNEPDDGWPYSLKEVADALPIKPGSNFVLTLREVPFEYDTAPNKATIILFDEDEEYTKTGESVRIMCIFFKPPSSTTSTALSE